jgi:hypothetical protein
VRESATTGASIHRGIHRASNRPRVPCFSATGRGRGHRWACLPVASVSMAARTLAATSTGLSDRFEGRLKELANQDNDTIMTTTSWGHSPSDAEPEHHRGEEQTTQPDHGEGESGHTRRFSLLSAISPDIDGLPRQLVRHHAHLRQSCIARSSGVRRLFHP